MAWYGTPDLRQILLATIPAISAVLCVLLGVSPIFSHTFGVLAPPLFLAAIFFWAMYRPDLMPVLLAFVIGLFFDLVSGTPLAVWAIISTVVAILAHYQTRTVPTTSFFMAWIAFAMVAVAACLSAWIMVCIARLAIVPFSPVAVQAGLLVAMYPALAYICGYVQQKLLVTRSMLTP